MAMWSVVGDRLPTPLHRLSQSGAGLSASIAVQWPSGSHVLAQTADAPHAQWRIQGASLP